MREINEKQDKENTQRMQSLNELQKKMRDVLGLRLKEEDRENLKRECEEKSMHSISISKN